MSKSQIIIDEKLANVHPGEVLKFEFLDEMGIEIEDLAAKINVDKKLIEQIISSKNAVTADIAIRLSRFFGTTAEFWLNLQNLYDLEEQIQNHAHEFDLIKQYAS